MDFKLRITPFSPSTKAELEIAVHLWCSNETVAQITYGPINDWDTSKITDMSSLFSGKNLFNGNISTWNVGQVINMGWMFEHASSFNPPLNNWDVSKVTFMGSMFQYACSFYQDLSSWQLSESMYNSLFLCTEFTSGIPPETPTIASSSIQPSPPTEYTDSHAHYYYYDNVNKENIEMKYQNYYYNKDDSRFQQY